MSKQNFNLINKYEEEMNMDRTRKVKQMASSAWDVVKKVELSTWIGLGILAVLLVSLIDTSWAVANPFTNMTNMVNDTKAFTTVAVTVLIAVCLMVAGGLSALGKIHWMWFVSAVFGAATLAAVETIMKWAGGAN